MRNTKFVRNLKEQLESKIFPASLGGSAFNIADCIRSDGIRRRIKWNTYYYDKDEQDSMKERLLSIGVMKEEIYMRDAKEFWD